MRHEKRQYQVEADWVTRWMTRKRRWQRQERWVETRKEEATGHRHMKKPQMRQEGNQLAGMKERRAQEERTSPKLPTKKRAREANVVRQMS